MPSGWKFFIHITEAGHLDNLQVWGLVDGTRPEWTEDKAKIIAAKQVFLSSEHPDFKIEKDKSALERSFNMTPACDTIRNAAVSGRRRPETRHEIVDRARR